MFYTRQRKIKIASALFDRLKRAAVQAGYSYVDEFIEHALEQAVERIENQLVSQTTSDRQQIDQQLRGLGYLE